MAGCQTAGLEPLGGWSWLLGQIVSIRLIIVRCLRLGVLFVRVLVAACVNNNVGVNYMAAIVGVTVVFVLCVCLL